MISGFNAWMNEDTLQKWWMRYNEICFGSDQSIPLAGTSKEDIHLYTALFICRVRAECRITQATTSKVCNSSITVPGEDGLDVSAD